MEGEKAGDDPCVVVVEKATVLAALHLTASHRRDEHSPRGIKKSFPRDVLQNKLRRSRRAS